MERAMKNNMKMNALYRTSSGFMSEDEREFLAAQRGARSHHMGCEAAS
jgi:hypothetical protein